MKIFTNCCLPMLQVDILDRTDYVTLGGQSPLTQTSKKPRNAMRINIVHLTLQPITLIFITRYDISCAYVMPRKTLKFWLIIYSTAKYSNYMTSQMQYEFTTLMLVLSTLTISSSLFWLSTTRHSQINLQALNAKAIIILCVESIVNYVNQIIVLRVYLFMK